MSLQRSLILFFAVALPVAGLRLGLDRLQSRPAEASSVPIVDRTYLVLQEVVEESSEPGRALPPEAFVHEAGGIRYAIVGPPVLDLGHVDAGKAQLAPAPDGSDRAALELPLTAEGARRMAAWSRDHVRHRLGIFISGELVSAAVVQEELRDQIRVWLGDRPTTERVLRAIRSGGAR